MADLTKIEWCDATLNLWWGCTKVSEGCKHCYADAWSKRHGRAVWGPNGTRLEVKSWRSTLAKISKRAKAEGRRLKVFVQSMSDTFEGPETMGGVDSENWATVQRLQYDLIIDAIACHPELDFLLLTKRPANVLGVFDRYFKDGFIPSNAWIGTSVEDQKTADERIPHLLKIPAKVRFLSCEPLLGPVDLTCVVTDRSSGEETNVLNGVISWLNEYDAGTYYTERHINWVIVGGESGPNARPMHPDWARSLRDQCQAAGVPFLFKQWGEWVEDAIGSSNPLHRLDKRSALMGEGFFDATPMKKVGKKAAGRTLDGRTWDEFPEAGR